MSRKAQRILKTIRLLIGLILFLPVLFLGFLMYFNAPPRTNPPLQTGEGLRIEPDGTVYLEVRRGESAQSVGKRLEEAGIIRSRYFWHLLSRFDREYIKTGSYQLELPLSQLKLRAILVSGRQMLQRVTIPEGITLKKMARLFEDAGVCGTGAFLAAAEDQDILDRYRILGKTMEGYLYPDTYLFPPDYPPDRVIRTMADTFFERLAQFGGDYSSLSPEELERRVIIASIVEREYRVDEEAALMAGVFYNRLRIGMALQSCATVEYVITEIQGRPHPDVLYSRDTEIRDPYNTYIRPGLPPGPISSPGGIALNAAFHPAASDYLYFRLVDASVGRHYFSRTLDDHIRAAALYVKGR
ncbi:MAG: endolytic transglycosylase MltG [Treponema sp.]|jgi:UPF0755 protein|nr:endolytic transglycosylase MltG [Treponema sp.]